MTKEELDQSLKALHLTQRGAAALMGINERTVRGWISGRALVPKYAEEILRLRQENERLRMVIGDLRMELAEALAT